MSAKNKILLTIGGLFTLVILFIVGSGYLSFSSSSESNYTDKLKQEASLIASGVEQKMLRNFDVLKMAANAIDVDGQGELNVDQLVNTLKFMEGNYGVVSAFYGAANGDTYRTGGLIANFNAKSAGREWYTRIMAGESSVMTTPYKATSGKLIMSLVEPVKRQGRIVGIIGVNVGLDELTTYIKELSGNNHLYVNRKDGYIISAHKPELIGKSLYQLRPSYAKYKNQSGSSHTYQADGDTYFVVNAISQELGWTVWSWEKQDNIMAASSDNLKSSIILAIIALLISLGVTYWVVMRLMYRPIGGEPTVIENMVKNTAKGDLSPVAKGGEIGILGAMLIMIANLKDTIKNIHQSAETLETASTQMSDTSSQVKTSSESQMAQLEQAATAMNEMSVSIDEVARNALKASDSAKEANTYSDQGLVVVNDMNQSVVSLVRSIEEVVEANIRLEKETQSIGQVLEVIDGLSEQTNLLALNAAIEAARAGEHGRGFAVVADEVRNLANKTKESTTAITDTIQHLQNEASHSVELMRENMNNAQVTSEKSEVASQALQQIQTAVSHILDMNTQIAAAVEEQSHVAAEIGANVEEINELARSTVAISDKNHARSRELTEIAGSMNKSIQIFRW
ncbi:MULTISPECIES: methyl-accepting chemotaxis protein [Vibrio]|uniref:Methyl-accepting chemotaxis protein n=2 Tax=Vibrio TaxID=662 RepID=A0A7X4RTA6_9VIBR|nr:MULTISPECIES: methyl-accepting chemotaxis protein [Vibrio]MBF9003145.1 methyl-accepting chemotaxis protein [Vibrio nitrifigilis]MZI91869.1 methyl-accepting chemotaxis protein [Vibrio eleionomae]